MHVQTLFLAAILARWRQPVSSVVALDPSIGLRLVPYRRITAASETASKYGAFFVIFLACDHVVRQGDMV